MGIILGYVLTFASGYAVAWLDDWVKERSIERKKLKWFLVSLQDDLAVAPLLYKSIKNEYDKTGYFSAVYAAKLRSNRQIYERYQEHLLQLPGQIRKEIKQYYFESNWLINYLESTSLKIFEFGMFVENSVANMEVQHPALGHFHAERIVKEAFVERIRLIDAFKNQVAHEIKKLSEFESEAALIMEKLKNLKL